LYREFFQGIIEKIVLLIANQTHLMAFSKQTNSQQPQEKISPAI